MMLTRTAAPGAAALAVSRATNPVSTTRGARSSAPVRARRQSFVQVAAAQSGAPELQPQPASNSRLRLLGLVSDAVAIDAQTQRFEQLAGRSAMIGFAVALCSEGLTSHSIFRTVSPDTAALLGSTFLAALALAAAAACASKRRMSGAELLEAVVTSLTAAQRSAASVTGQQVDASVDSVLNASFTQGVIYRLLAEDEDVLV